MREMLNQRKFDWKIHDLNIFFPITEKNVGQYATISWMKICYSGGVSQIAQHIPNFISTPLVVLRVGASDA